MQVCNSGANLYHTLSVMSTGTENDSSALESTAEMLHSYLKIHGTLPDKHRLLIWQHILDVPRNAPAFQVDNASLLYAPYSIPHKVQENVFL